MTPVNPKHGTANAYQVHRCRCDDCRTFMRTYRAEQRDRYRALRVEQDGRLVAAHLPAERHGKPNTYFRHSCRCEPCTQAGSGDRSARRRRPDPVSRDRWEAIREEYEFMRSLGLSPVDACERAGVTPKTFRTYANHFGYKERP